MTGSTALKRISHLQHVVLMQFCSPPSGLQRPLARLAIFHIVFSIHHHIHAMRPAHNPQPTSLACVLSPRVTSQFQFLVYVFDYFVENKDFTCSEHRVCVECLQTEVSRYAGGGWPGLLFLSCSSCLL